MESSKNNKIYELLNKHIVIPVTNKINEHSKHLKNNSNEIDALRLWIKILIVVLIINLLFSFYLFISNIRVNSRLEEVYTQLNNNNSSEENVNKPEITVEENIGNSTIEQKNYSNTDSTINNSSNNSEEINNYSNDNQNSQPQNNYSETYENNNQQSNNTKYEIQENYDDDTPPTIENVERNKGQQNSDIQNNNSRIDDLRSKKEQLLRELNDY